MVELDTIPVGSYASSSECPPLPPLDSLQLWVQRPQAIAKCFVSDLYKMQACLRPGYGPKAQVSRDVFLLNNYPCRMVEIVGWAAAVEHKEATMTITVDDGDGQHVIPVIIHLPQKKVPVESPAPSPTAADSLVFKSAKERKAERSKTIHLPPALRKGVPPVKTYVRYDIRVGDTVRVVGRMDEWGRKRPNGDIDWVRNVVVEEGSGGKLSVVDPDEQYHHAAQVTLLHETLYCKPFTIPPLPVPGADRPVTSSLPTLSQMSVTTDSINMSSEISEVDMSTSDDVIKLRDPSCLRPSQISESTFRQYVLDYINQETISAIDELRSTGGPESLQTALSTLFPEYHQMLTSTGSGLSKGRSSQSQGVYYDRPTRSPLEAFTLSSILAIPHLSKLAGMVIDSETRKNERRRLRRIRDKVAKQKDLDVEEDRVRQGLKATDWKLSDPEKLRKMKKLVTWVIRGIANDGGIVEVNLRQRSGYPSQISPNISQAQYRNTPSGKTGDKAYSSAHSQSCQSTPTASGFLPLPPQLLFPLITPIIQREHFLREDVFMRKTDPRKHNGITVEEIVKRLQAWGEEGRWERAREWVIRDTMDWGVKEGLLKPKGQGWWLADETQM